MLKLLIKIIKKTFYIIYITIKFTIESYIIFFRYLFTSFPRHFFIVSVYLLMVLLILLHMFLRFMIRRYFTLRLFLKDCRKVLPFFFRRPDEFTKYCMNLSWAELKKQQRRRSRFRHLYCFILFVVFSLFFYDMADEETMLILYEFHKWW